MRSNFHHGSPRKSAAIATAVSAAVEPQKFIRPSATVALCHGNHSIRGKHHGSPRTPAAIAAECSPDVEPQQSTRSSAAVRGHGDGNCHVNRRQSPLQSRLLQPGNPTLLPPQAMGSHVDHGGARQREPAYAILVMYYHKQIEQPLKRGILQSISDSKARHRNLNALRSWLLYLLAYVGVAKHGRGC